MEITLLRRHKTGGATEGELWVDGVKVCYTLEDRTIDWTKEQKTFGKTAIPEGKYRVVLSRSTRFKKILPEVLNVPHFTGIRIHTGNKPADTEGCILVGEDPTKPNDSWIGRSRDAMEELQGLIKRALDRGEKVWLTVK